MTRFPLYRSSFYRSAIRVALLLPSLLCGCRLVDQTTFDPALRAKMFPPKKAAAKPVTPVVGPPPLLTVHFEDDADSVDYQDSLRLAVQQALARKPDVRFDVVTIVPEKEKPEEQMAVAQHDSGDARQIAGQIEHLGVDAGQIALGIRPESGLTGHDVKIYVH